MANRYESSFSFGTVDRIKAESFGQPGQRTFRLLIEAGQAIASLWLEKEQLQHLAVYIQEVSDTLEKEEGSASANIPETAWSGEPRDFDFKVGQLALGHDAASRAFLFLVHNVETTEEGAPADLSFWVPLEKARELSQEAITICNAGRPRCFLCGQAINSEGHMCIRSNGHQSFKP